MCLYMYVCLENASFWSNKCWEKPRIKVFVLSMLCMSGFLVVQRFEKDTISLI